MTVSDRLRPLVQPPDTTGGLTQQDCVPRGPGGPKPKSRVAASLASCEGHVPACGCTFFLPVSWWGVGRLTPSSQGANPIMAPPHWPHLTLITSQRPHLPVPSPWGAGAATFERGHKLPGLSRPCNEFSARGNCHAPRGALRDSVGSTGGPTRPRALPTRLTRNQPDLTSPHPPRAPPLPCSAWESQEPPSARVWSCRHASQRP